jgi:hypothetical protein
MAASLKKAFMGPARPASSTMSRRACLTVESLEERQLMATGVAAVFSHPASPVRMYKIAPIEDFRPMVLDFHVRIEGSLQSSRAWGFYIRKGNEIYELTHFNDPSLRNLAKQLLGKQVVVEGMDTSVGRGRGTGMTYHSISVSSLKEQNKVVGKVKIEGTLTTGFKVWGAGATGYAITNSQGSWKLDEGNNLNLRALATQLEGMQVVVEGLVTSRHGLEISKPSVIIVSSLTLVQGKLPILGRAYWSSFGFGQAPLQQVLRSEKELAAALQKLVANQPNANGKPIPVGQLKAELLKKLNVQNIDWKNQMLVVVSDGSKPCVGYGVRIDGLVVQNGTLAIHWTEIQPEPWTKYASMITHPVHVVLVPRFNGPVNFVRQEPVTPLPPNFHIAKICTVNSPEVAPQSAAVPSNPMITAALPSAAAVADTLASAVANSQPASAASLDQAFVREYSL